MHATDHIFIFDNFIFTWKASPLRFLCQQTEDPLSAAPYIRFYRFCINDLKIVHSISTRNATTNRRINEFS